MKQSQKRLIRRLLQLLHLEKPLRSLYRSVLRLRLNRQYGNQTIHDVSIGGVTVHFSLEDLYSRRYFLLGNTMLPEPLITQFIVERLPQAYTFVDIGANLGYYTCIAARLMPQGQVYAFELDSMNLALTERNIQLNKFQNVKLEHAAVSNATGTLDYVRDTDSPSQGFGLSTNQERDRQIGTLVKVTSFRLDDYFAGKMIAPAVFKIDVEGAELQVLQGMENLLNQPGITLFVEVHPEKIVGFGATANDVLNLLLDHGYQVYELNKLNIDQPTPLTREAHLSLNNILYAMTAPIEKVQDE
ncbi:MAG TPA: FkbM family methyltransferase [Phototrophicaceae bacterium]|jgi:FkbM family methyltransferase|nr:FkbM family methyltransferase [Phototrophicaceae bacterium]